MPAYTDGSKYATPDYEARSKNGLAKKKVITNFKSIIRARKAMKVSSMGKPSDVITRAINITLTGLEIGFKIF